MGRQSHTALLSTPLNLRDFKREQGTEKEQFNSFSEKVLHLGRMAENPHQKKHRENKIKTPYEGGDLE